MTQDPRREIGELLRLSARVGSDPLLVQASSGNTSIKLDGVLWIKASGKWLARASDDDWLVPVSLADVRAGLQRDQEVSTSGASIETAMHAVIAAKVVIHVHSVNTICWAVRADGRERVAEKLAGLKWSWIPYSGSGLPLAQAIRAEIARSPESNVFVLANHGLVVCGDNCRAAELILDEVENRLAVPPRSQPNESDSVSSRILQRGILVPCQILITALDCDEMTDCQRAIFHGIEQVARRIDDRAPIRYLSDSEIADLIRQDIHGYLARAELNAVKVKVPLAVQEGVPAEN